MSRRLLLAVSPGEIWAALVEDDKPVALRLVRTHGEARPGDLYLGRVVGLRPAVPAALVDIGEARPGFLGDAATLRDGEAVLVKVTKAARADKAAGLTAKLKPEEAKFATRATNATPPLLLHRPKTALAALLDEFSDVDEIVIDDAAVLADVKRHVTGAARLHAGATPLFEAAGVASAIETALAPRVALPNGGTVTIEATSAAILIDVDGGRAGALVANLGAAREIARQIRWRDLSGPIVVDFIGMRQSEHRARVAAALKDALGGEAQYLGWTRLGHFELVLKRRRPSLTEMLFDAAGQKQPLTVALEALRQIQHESRAAPGKRFMATVHPEVAACFDGAARAAKHELEARLGYAIKIAAEPRTRDSFAIVPALPISTSR
ncbi:MAG TPA: ribonuclease E/G [Stellaceae bacterium]|jgi:Ribonuclease G/E|nr:ribonuclease E/G [Stellaceae bacterium]